MAYDDADLKELRQEFSDDTAEWNDIRKEGQKDMRSAAGDPWEPRDRQVREDAGRPCLSLDELSQYTNQVVNEVRANKRAVKFAPVGNGANDDTAAFYADKMREIEYRSSAQISYTTAFENAVQRSYGFCRVAARYEHPKALYQDLWIDPVHNPDLVTPDPYALMPNLSDMKRCWVREPWTLDDFNRRFPDYKLSGKAHTDLMRTDPTWITDRMVMVSEYWKIETTRRKLLIIQPSTPIQPRQPGAVLGLQQPQQGQAPPPDPIAVWADDKNRPPGKVIDERMVDDPKVSMCLTNGVEKLDETPWPGRYIPIIGCLGKVLFLDEGMGSRRKILSLIRLARDPYMLYCYYRTCEAELVGMTPKFPYFYYEGTLDQKNLELIAKSLHEPVAAIAVKPHAHGPTQEVLPMPQRQPYEPPIAALEVGAEAARRAIQAAIGQSPLPTVAQRRNEKSGVALKRIEEAGQRGSFHFTDHYLDMIQHVGVVIEDLLDKYYDTKREVGIRKANDEAEVVTINDPADPKSSTRGDHLVTVTTGPSFDSEREAASDFADTLSQVSPELFALLGPLIVKLKNLGPIGDEMAELLETIQPPQVQALRASKKEQGDPAQAQQQLMQMKAQLEQVMQAAQQMQQALETEQAKQQAQVEKAKIDAETKLVIARMAEETRLGIAKLQNLVKPGQEAEADHIEAELQRRFDAIMAEREHEHALELEAVKARHAEEQEERQHEHALAQGEQGIAGSLAAGNQAVAGKLAVEKAKPKPTRTTGD
jgi:hypothetical protein